MEPFSIKAPLPTGTLLLEASAGTGKTWMIAALVTRFVAEGEVTLPEMLVVTFSRAASQELRARVRAQLVEAERALATGEHDTGNALLSHLLDADPEEVRRRHARVRVALTSFDAATIATVHQFCQQVLRSLGVAGTADASAELVEDLDELLVEVVDDLYLGRFATEASPAFSRADALRIARAAVDDIYADVRPRTADPTTTAARRAKFARAVRSEVATRKRRLQVMHYNDLLTELAAALEEDGSPARDRMRHRWKVVLVDEFQDTDPIQWQVLERAFHGHARMVLIGDPKQAIYAFRGGDIVTYLGAARSAADRRTLPDNYRSDPGVVDALRVMLEGAQLGDADIAVHPVSAKRSDSRLAGAPSDAPVRLRQILLEDHLRGDALIAATRNHISRDLALDVAALLSSGATFEGRPIRAHDVAVLAYRAKDLLAAQRALREVGVHAVTTGGSSVLESRSAHDWLTLLEAMAAPHRSALTRAAALTDLLGMTVTEVDAGGETLDDELAQRIRELTSIYERQGVAAVLERLNADGLTGRVLALVGGERTLTDIKHVAELLHEAGRDGELGLVTLLEWLRLQMAEDTPTSAGARTRRLDSDAAAVQLVTIHGSKGLQYPVVYLPTLTDRSAGRDPAIPLFHDDPPESTRAIDVGGKGNGNPEWTESVRRHKEEDAGESLRLLYVALTRAQSQVVTWWSPTKYNTGASPLHRVLFGRGPGEGPVPPSAGVPDDARATERLSAWAAQGAFALERADLAPVLLPSPEEPSGELRLARWSRRIDTDWRRTSYTALSTPRDDQGHELTGGVGSEPEADVTALEDEPDAPTPVVDETPLLPGFTEALPGSDVPSPMADLPVGATFGSLVHGVLEHADPQAPDLRAELLRHVEEQLVYWPVWRRKSTDDASGAGSSDTGASGADSGGASSAGSGDADAEQARLAEDLADALVMVCRSPLGPLADNVTLVDIGRHDRLCELDFELPLGGGDEGRPGNDAAVVHGVLGDLAPLLRAHLPTGDPVRGWADVLDAAPELAAQQLRGYLTGSIDVVLRTGGRYLVVDYKTNWLGTGEEPLTAADYRPEQLDEAMGHSSYPLQALLYSVVAHRFLRWRVKDYSPSRHLGGVLYLYVRGMCGPDTPVVDGHPCGVFSWRPPVALVTAVSDLLDGTRAEVSP